MGEGGEGEEDLSDSPRTETRDVLRRVARGRRTELKDVRRGIDRAAGEGRRREREKHRPLEYIAKRKKKQRERNREKQRETERNTEKHREKRKEGREGRDPGARSVAGDQNFPLRRRG